MIYNTTIYFRADGNHKVGLGHVYRLLGLCDRLKSHFTCKFLIQNPAEATKQMILQHCHDVIALPESNDFITEFEYFTSDFKGNEIVVLDGYAFTASCQQVIKSKGVQLVVIDDIHREYMWADYVFNFGGEDLRQLYRSAWYTQFYFGFRYAIFREEFIKAARGVDVTRADKVNNRVFISLGGADPMNHTKEMLLKAVTSYPFNHYCVVLGSHYRHLQSIEDIAAKHQVELHINVEAKEMASIMRSCDIAICSSSTVAYEYLMTGGKLYMIQTADNQTLLYNYLLSLKIAQPVDLFFDPEVTPVFDYEQHYKLIQSNLNFSYPELFRRLAQGGQISIRSARLEDAYLYFEWTNDPETRRQSFNSAPVLWESHEEWFNNKISSTTTKMYVLQIDSSPVAQVRFEIEDDFAMINYSVDAKNRGKGIAGYCIKYGVLKLKEDCDRISLFQALVKKENVASVKTFEKLNFERLEKDEFTWLFQLKTG